MLIEIESNYYVKTQYSTLTYFKFYTIIILTPDIYIVCMSSKVAVARIAPKTSEKVAARATVTVLLNQK